jgi:hypothetical protein
MPHETGHVRQEVYLPAGFYAWAAKFDGAALPRGAAITGAGINAGALTAAAIAEALGNSIAAELVPLISNGVVLREVYVRLGSNDGLGLSFTRLLTATGGDLGSPTSPNVTYLFKASTNLGGKRGRGRFYLPGVTEGSVSEAGNLGGDKRTALTAGAVDLLTAMDAVTLPLAIAHRYPEGFIGPKLAPSVVTLLTVDPRVATQRGRLR